MPHLTLEYTKNLETPADFSTLFGRLHDVLVEVGGIKRANCKSRTHPLDTYFVAGGEKPAGFVHLDVRFLEGRSDDLKQAIGERMLSVLEDQFEAPDQSHDFQITVEVSDILRGSYFKFPSATLGPGP